MKRLIAVIGSIALASGLAAAQNFGAIRGRAADTEGNPLPGVSVTLTGSRIDPRSVVTTVEGNFLFPGLFPAADYALEFGAPGFKTLLRTGLRVRFGAEVRLNVVLESTAPEETATLEGASPMIDPFRPGPALTLPGAVILSLPTARDPWSLAVLAPGTLRDREDVGGNESGLQSILVLRGTGRADSAWFIDGVDVGDPAAPGEAPAYLNLSNFEEVDVVESAGDANVRTGGIQLHFVTKRGGSIWSGLAYFDVADKKFEMNNVPAALTAAGYGNPGLNLGRSYGAHFAGPVVGESVWLAGAFGVQDVDKRNLSGRSETAKLSSGYVNFDAKISSSSRFNLLVETDAKKAWNRTAWSDVEQASETMWNQTAPVFILKSQLDNDWGALRLQTKAVYTRTDDHLAPVLGARTSDGSGSYQIQSFFPSFYVTGNIDDYRRTRDQWGLSASGTLLLERVLGGDHEVRFGAEFRSAVLASSDVYEGNLVLYDYGFNWIEADVLRDAVGGYRSTRYSAFFQDASTWGRLALTFGLRYDYEKSVIQDQSVAASPWFSQYLQAQSVTEYDPGAAWSVLSPRLGLSWDIGGDGKNVLRLSLSVTGSQAGFDSAVFANPAGAGIGLLWRDANGDGRVQPGELWGYDWSRGTLADPSTPRNWLYSWGFDPADPSRFTTLNKIDPAYNSPLLDEIIFSYEKEIAEDFAGRFEVIYRKYHRLTVDRGLFADGTIETAANWYLYGHNDLLDADFWTRRVQTVGMLRTNSATRFEQETAAQFVLSKRYAHGWMLNASFTYSNWTDNGDDSFDRTNASYFTGAPVAIESSAEGLSGVYVDSRWMAKLIGLVDLPWGFRASGIFLAREGYIIPTFVIIRRPLIGTSVLYGQAGGGGVFGDTRLPALATLNLRLEKTFEFGNRARLTFGADGFNITNAATVLKRAGRIGASNFLQDQVILNPALFRFGLRFEF